MITIPPKVFLPFLFILFFNFAYAQEEFPAKQITQDELKMSVYPRDSSAHAVVLNEYGYATIDVSNQDGLRLIFKYHAKVKVFDEEGIKQGTIEIPLYNGKEYGEEISDIEGITSYITETGVTRTEKLTSAQIFKIRVTDHYTNVKLAMPAMHKGCVFEYEYTTTSPYWEAFHTWEFQSDIPKVTSLYEVKIPGFWLYNAVKIGALKLDRKEAKLDRNCLSVGGGTADCSHEYYAINNIPAFVEEDYMTSSNNFRTAIHFELSEGTNPYTGVHTKYAKDWKDVDYQLKHAEYFGIPVKRKDLLKDKIAPIIAGTTDDLTKAKKVYTYVQNAIKWNGINYFGTENVRKTFDSHSGNAGDVNLALLAALNSAGINAEPVLLSTRNHGILNKLYPVITEFNYVVIKTDIGDKSYLLDATDRLLDFGTLPLRCLNDQGRVMPLDKPSYWIDMKSPVIDASTTILNLVLNLNGKLVGTVTHYSKGYAAYQQRNVIKKFNSVDEYVENLDTRWNKMKIKKADIRNLDSLDQALTEVYEVEIEAYDNTNHERLSFNPFFFEKITRNPFRLKERSYPVDWGMPSDHRFIINVQLPENYTIENPPQNIGFGLPENGGMFAVNYTQNENTFSLSHVTQFKRSIYSSEDYPYLKELYNKIILSEKTELILKKKI